MTGTGMGSSEPDSAVLTTDGPQSIFHYTSIESLALILRSNSIRFTRLDQVDDLLEAQSQGGVAFGKAFFASCWTRESQDLIPQWHMYSRNMQGVRIDLPVYPFRRIALGGEWLGIPLFGTAESPLSYDECVGTTYVIQIPAKPEWFARDVEYVDDVIAEYKKSVSKTIGEFGQPHVLIENMPRLGSLKGKTWEFQQELRFLLTVYPATSADGMPLKMATTTEYWAELVNGFLQGRDPGVTFIDVPIDPAVLERLVVRLGPRCTPGQQVCVEALLAQFAPNAHLEVSKLAVRA